MRRCILCTLCLALLVAPAAAQVRSTSGTMLSDARELYASARYDEALAVLNTLRPDEAAVPERKSIAQYRSLCLLALGRDDEAEEAIATVVTSDPLFQPNESDAAPRVRAAFRDVRDRLLPEIAASRYASAKAAYDRKAHEAAEHSFRELLLLLDDPQMRGRLPDLRVLAAGFLELSAAAAAPPPQAEEPAEELVESRPPVPDPERVYLMEDEGVQPPGTIRQELPGIPFTLRHQIRDRGLLEVVIDEAGRVSFMALRVGIHPQYDTMLLAAAREWRYQPATLNGTPVKFRKLIRIAHQR
jgi:tetratricopeptide (TPR) repeat protein